MASYNELNALIDAYINRNGVQAITGQILNGVLKAMVEQLGRGYTIMGAATPAIDPGTPDGPECYFASETGTYTDFDGLQVAPGELALLCYTPTDGWTKATIYEGFRQVGATIDGNVGTPSVGVSYANGVLSFDFHNMKGNPGADGNDGAPAGFGTIDATVDGNIGTPGVSVQSSGPNTAKNLTFAFTNLKGETGVTSVIATVDNTTGTPACTVSLVGQQLTLAFTGLKGAQGNTGSSVDYPFTIVNNLTTDDATQALSAAQGVVLQGEITQLEAKVDDLIEDLSETSFVNYASDADLKIGTGTWNSATGAPWSLSGYSKYKKYFTEDTVITYNLTDQYSCIYNEPAGGTKVLVASGVSSGTFTVLAGGAALWSEKDTSSGNNTVGTNIVGGLKDFATMDDLDNAVEPIEEKQEAIETSLTMVLPPEKKMAGQINGEGSTAGLGVITTATNPRVFFFKVKEGWIIDLKAYVSANATWPKLAYAFYSVYNDVAQDASNYISGGETIITEGAFSYDNITVPSGAKMLVVMGNNGHETVGTDVYAKAMVNTFDEVVESCGSLDGIIATTPELVPGEQRYLDNGDYNYVGWPYSTPLYDKTNNLISVFYANKKTHQNTDNGVLLMKQLNMSTGVWSSPILVAGEPDTPYKCFYGYASTIDNDGNYIVLCKDAMTQGYLYICKSTDLGQTWTKTQIRINNVVQSGDCPCSIIKTSTGRYLCFVAIFNYILYTDDNFATFGRVDLGTLGEMPYEGGLIQLGDGTICLIVRQNVASGETRAVPLFLKSNDNGATWTTPAKAFGLDAESCPVAIKRDETGTNYLYYISRHRNTQNYIPFHIMRIPDGLLKDGIFIGEKTIFQTPSSGTDTGYGGVAIDGNNVHWWFFYNTVQSLGVPRIWYTKVQYGCTARIAP